MYKTYKEFDEATGFAAKAGFQLTKKQVELVEQLGGWRKSLNKSEVGCGKTVMATVSSLMHGYKVSLITVPPILITGWGKWLNKVSSGVVIYRGNPRERHKLLPLLKTARWIICSHAIYRTDYESLKDAIKDRDYEVTVDECFVAGTLITTDLGDLPIEDVVEKLKGTLALSFNFSTNVLEWKKIVRRLANPKTKTLVKVTHETGNFICTDSHKIATFADCGEGPIRQGWTKAGELQRGRLLKVFQNTAINGDALLQGLRSQIRSPDSSLQGVLLDSLQDGGAEVKPRVSTEVERLDAKHMGQLPDKGHTSTRCSRKNAAEQPHEELRVSGENDEYVEGHWTQTESSRGERNRAVRAAETSSCTDARSNSGVCGEHKNCAASFRQTSEMLQARLSVSRNEIGYRDRRGVTQFTEKTGTGPEESGNTNFSRVVSVEIYESGSSDGHSESSRNYQKVYDLEIEDNHNYFANGVLVSNCHALKNPQSVLFKRIQLMTAGDAGCQLLSGTPVSKPLDGYSYIKLKHPKVYRSYGHFEAMHVADRDFFKKPIAFCNLDMLASNLNIQTVSANKEEMHGYNLKPLTPDCSYDLDPEHYRLYAKLVDEQLLSFDDGSVIDASTSQKLRQALQQVVVNWDYFANDPSKKSAAYDLLDQTLEEIEVERLDKSKLIVWVQYKRTARSVLEYCNKLGIRTVAAYSEADTEKSVQAFLEDDKTRILVGHPQSCGAGLNPQGVCSEALFLEMSTVPLYMHQSMGRIDRMGQTRVPRFKFAVANRTVQTGLLASLLNGDDLMQRVTPTKTSIRAMLMGEI